MTPINWSRVFLGGLVAGVIIDASEFLANGVFLAQNWANAMKALNQPEMSATTILAFNITGLITGIFAVWLYAAVRSRYGAGPKIALGAGAATWFIGYLVPSIAPAAMHLFPRRLLAIGVAVGLIEMVVGTLAGAYLYNEAGERQAASKAKAAAAS